MSSEISLRLVNSEYRVEDALFDQVSLKINGSIVKHDGRYYCAYRTDHLFNYDGKNYISELDKSFKPISHKKLNPENSNTAIEDIRLFSFNKKLMAIYTYLPKNENNTWEWSYGIAMAEVDVDSGLLVRQQSLRHLAKNKDEKNWVPYTHNRELFLIASFSPSLRIIKVTGNSGEFEFAEVHDIATNTKEWQYGELRGGTPLISNPYRKDKWLYGFVHSSVHLPNGNASTKFYFYTVVRFSPAENRFKFYNSPLSFSKRDIADATTRPAVLNSKDINMSIKVVFPMGLINYKDGMLLSYGKDDVTTRLRFYSWEYIVRLFKDTNKIGVM